MKHFIELDQSQFPILTDDQHLQLLEFHSANNHLANLDPSFIQEYPYTITARSENKKPFLTELFNDYDLADWFLEGSSTFKLEKGLPPHRDRASVSIIYVIKGQATTSWWSNGIDAPTWKMPQRAFLYTEQEKKGLLTKVESTVFDLHKWYMFDNNAIHSVSELTGDRTALTCSLNAIFKSFEDARNNLDKLKIFTKK